MFKFINRLSADLRPARVSHESREDREFTNVCVIFKLMKILVLNEKSGNRYNGIELEGH